MFIIASMVEILCLVIVLFCSTLCSFQCCNHIDGEERAYFFTLIISLKSCDCKCSVALPHGPVSWYAVFDCGIS